MWLVTFVVFLFSVFSFIKFSIASNSVIFEGLFIEQKSKNCYSDNFRLFLAIYSPVLQKEGIWSNHLLMELSPFKKLLFKNTLSFSVAWFTQNRFLTRITSSIFSPHISFATFFHYFFRVQICCFSKLELYLGCGFEWWKSFVDTNFQLQEFCMQTLGFYLKRAPSLDASA